MCSKKVIAKKVIKSINEITDDDDNMGYVIKLEDSSNNKSQISFKLDTDQRCCEITGYMCSDDNFDDFIGAEVEKVFEVNQSKLSSIIYDKLEEYVGDRCTRAIFLNVKTNRGTLQFALYNNHNGYYGHEYKIEFGNNKVEEGEI